MPVQGRGRRRCGRSGTVEIPLTALLRLLTGPGLRRPPKPHRPRQPRAPAAPARPGPAHLRSAGPGETKAARPPLPPRCGAEAGAGQREGRGGMGRGGSAQTPSPRPRVPTPPPRSPPPASRSPQPDSSRLESRRKEGGDRVWMHVCARELTHVCSIRMCTCVCVQVCLLQLYAYVHRHLCACVSVHSRCASVCARTCKCICVYTRGCASVLSLHRGIKLRFECAYACVKHMCVYVCKRGCLSIVNVLCR